MGAVSARCIVLSATATDAGKTHLAEALIMAWPHERPLTIWKPYESGLAMGAPADSERLAAAARAQGHRFEPPLARFSAPLAPPVAARLEGQALPSSVLLAHTHRLLAAPGALLIELAGGLLAPLTDDALGLDFASQLEGCELVVVAPNRLGVLHDVLALVRAAQPLRVGHLVLMHPERPDASTPHNAAELATRLPGLTLHELPWAPPRALRSSVEALVSTLSIASALA